MKSFFHGFTENRRPIKSPPEPLPKWDTFFETDLDYIKSVEGQFPKQKKLHKEAALYVRDCLRQFKAEGFQRVKVHRKFTDHMTWFLEYIFDGRPQTEIASKVMEGGQYSDDLTEKQVSKAIRGIAEMLGFPYLPNRRGSGKRRISRNKV